MRKWPICLAFLFLTLRVFAEVGVVTPLNLNPADSLLPQPIPVQGEQAPRAPAACATISPRNATAAPPRAGTPIIAKVLVTQRDGALIFTLSLRDSHGNAMNKTVVNGKPVLSRVNFKVVDATGTVVYRNTFEHG